MNFLNYAKESIKLLSGPLKPKNDIYHFKFTKAITKSNVERFTSQLKSIKARKPRVVVLSVNTAVGDMVYAQIAHDALKQFSNDLQIPIHSFAEDYALGVGYYLLSAGNRVYANPFSMLGEFSLSHNHFSLNPNICKGIHQEQYGNNIIMSSLQTITGEQRSFIQTRLNNELQTMIQTIQNNRTNISLPTQALSAEQALQKGLIDEILTFEEFYGRNYSNLSLKEIALDRSDLMIGGLRAKELQIFSQINDILGNIQSHEVKDLFLFKKGYRNLIGQFPEKLIIIGIGTLKYNL